VSARHVACLGRAAAAIFVAAVFAACGRRPAAVATLIDSTGVVEGARGTDGTWLGVAPATEFVIDDAVRTGEQSSARLSVVSGGTIRLSEHSRLRFRRGGATDTAGVELGIDLGRAELENTGALSIVTAGGTARIDRGSHVRITADGTRETFEVIVGRAVLLAGSGGDVGVGRSAPVIVGPGRGVTFRIGTAVMEWFSVQVGEAVLEPAGSGPAAAQALHTSPSEKSGAPAGAGGSAPLARAQPSSALSSPGARSASEHGAETEASDARRADVTVTAGDSVVLHDGKPPLLVRLRFADLCPGGGTVEVGPRGRGEVRLTGTAAVVARLGPGVHLYRLHCTSEGDRPPRASGVLTVKRDSGNVPLARRAATNLIEADGRRYTVLFQTQLPAMTLLWARTASHAAGELAVHVESGAGARVFHTRELSLRLPAGTLGEGEHTWWFATADGRESPKTIVAIRFDNTAPTAQFFPAGHADAPLGTVPIDGVTVKGAKVSAAGKSVIVDEHGRFQDAVAPIAGDDAVAVRVEVPHGEAHYYVKRRAQAR